MYPGLSLLSLHFASTTEPPYPSTLVTNSVSKQKELNDM